MSGAGGANGSKGPGASVQHRWRTWQSDEDIPQRKELIQHILKIFKQRKPDVTKEWQHKLPDFVLRLEEAVYRGARSKVRSLSDRL